MVNQTIAKPFAQDVEKSRLLVEMPHEEFEGSIVGVRKLIDLFVQSDMP